MSQEVKQVAVIAVSTYAAIKTGGALAAYSPFVQGLGAAGASIATSMALSKALGVGEIDQDNSLDFGSLSNYAKQKLQNTKTNTATLPTIYGFNRVGGNIIWQGVNPSDSTEYFSIIALRNGTFVKYDDSGNPSYTNYKGALNTSDLGSPTDGATSPYYIKELEVLSNIDTIRIRINETTGNNTVFRSITFSSGGTGKAIEDIQTITANGSIEFKLSNISIKDEDSFMTVSVISEDRYLDFEILEHAIYDDNLISVYADNEKLTQENKDISGVDYKYFFNDNNLVSVTYPRNDFNQNDSPKYVDDTFIKPDGTDDTLSNVFPKTKMKDVTINLNAYDRNINSSYELFNIATSSVGSNNFSGSISFSNKITNISFRLNFALTGTMQYLDLKIGTSSGSGNLLNITNSTSVPYSSASNFYFENINTDTIYISGNVEIGLSDTQGTFLCNVYDIKSDKNMSLNWFNEDITAVFGISNPSSPTNTNTLEYDSTLEYNGTSNVQNKSIEGIIVKAIFFDLTDIGDVFVKVSAKNVNDSTYEELGSGTFTITASSAPQLLPLRTPNEKYQLYKIEFYDTEGGTLTNKNISYIDYYSEYFNSSFIPSDMDYVITYQKYNASTNTSIKNITTDIMGEKVPYIKNGVIQTPDEFFPEIIDQDLESYIYNNNPVGVLLHFLQQSTLTIGDNKYNVGLGLNVGTDGISNDDFIGIDTASFETAQDYMNDIGFTFNYVFSESAAAETIINEILTNARLKLTLQDGKLFLYADKKSTIGKLVTDRDILEDSFSAYYSQANYNKIVNKWTNPSESWQVQEEVYQDDTLISSDGKVLELNNELKGVTNKQQAKNMAELSIKTLRYSVAGDNTQQLFPPLIINFTMQITGLDINVGDIIEFNHTEMWNYSKYFDIISKTVKQDDTIEFEAIEYNTTVINQYYT